MLTLDHFAIAAQSLEAGRTVVEETLGVRLAPGGQHGYYGTHNLLLGLEDGLYLEVIAIDRAAPTPGYARWFDLDRFAGRPRPTNWICRTNDIAQFTRAFPKAGVPVGLARGTMRWQMAVPSDGVLPFENRFPAVMQWSGTAHPSQVLPNSGVTLKRLVVAHPQAKQLAKALHGQVADPRVVFEPGASGLRIELTTPQGLRVLE